MVRKPCRLASSRGGTLPAPVPVTATPSTLTVTSSVVSGSVTVSVPLAVRVPSSITPALAVSPAPASTVMSGAKFVMKPKSRVRLVSLPVPAAGS